ncbi:MAG: ribonuclease HII [Syntrophaceae bacterium]
MDQYERNAYGRGFKVIAGLDEAGRGPLAGPVVAAAVVLPQDYINSEIKDSKQLSARKREQLFKQIKTDALSIGLGVIEPSIIDKINILHASLLAMKEAVENLSIPVDYLLIDGIFKIKMDIEQETIVAGDSASVSVASASIVAKVSRDRIMDIYHRQYPQYNFCDNKGYATVDHRKAILEFGCCKIHRRSFRPVREAEEGLPLFTELMEGLSEK